MKKEKIVLDAEGCTMGRLAAYAAKQALEGKKVVIFNAEKAIISGKESEIFPDYKKRYDAKSQTNPWRYGPKRPKNPDRFLRRVIRGMLPWNKPRGKEAFRNVMVYMGRPEKEILKKEQVDLSKAKLADNSGFKSHYDYFITVGHLCKYLGGKNE
jgi:large subunit ribosomal protein L13